MAEGFRVDLPALHAAASGIRDTAAQAEAVPLEPVGAAAAHARLGAALDGFASRWATGVSALASDGTALADRLAAAESAYRSVDAAATGMLERSAGPDPAAR